MWAPCEERKAGVDVCTDGKRGHAAPWALCPVHGDWRGWRGRGRRTEMGDATGRLAAFSKDNIQCDHLESKQHTPASLHPTDSFDQNVDADHCWSLSHPLHFLPCPPLAVRFLAIFAKLMRPEPGARQLAARGWTRPGPGGRASRRGVTAHGYDSGGSPDQDPGRLLLGRFQFRAWECFLFVFDGISTILNSMFSLLSSAHLYIAQTRFHVNPPLPHSLPRALAHPRRPPARPRQLRP